MAKSGGINKMNDGVIFCRFSVPEEAPDILTADYYLPFGEGVPAFLVVWALRLFARVDPARDPRSDDDHVDTQFTRYREDGSVIAAHDSLYVLTCENNKWGVKMRSSYPAR